MDKKSDVAVGFSVSPTLISAVTISMKDFSIMRHAEKSLSSAIVSHDAKHILDAPTLIPLIKEIMSKIGNPRFSDPVYLSLMPPCISTKAFAGNTNPELIRTWLREDSPVNNESPFLQYNLLDNQKDKIDVIYSVLESQLVKDYISVFYEAGLKISAIDVLPFCILRSMAASGVLDMLINKIDYDSLWGFFGTSGSQTWCTLWKRTHLLQAFSFTTPSNQSTWEERIIEFLNKAGIDPTDLAIWLEWHESGMMLPVNSLKLNLKAPVRSVMLGRIYQQLSQSSFPALGAALKSEIVFPFGWNFINVPDADPLNEEYKTIPYSNYQPVLPKLFYWISIISMFLVLAASGYLWWQNRDMAKHIATQDKLMQEEVDNLLNKNDFYFEIFEHINKNANGFKLELISFNAKDELKIRGQTDKKHIIDKFKKLLTDNNDSKNINIVIKRQSVIPDDSLKTMLYFELTGKARSNNL